MNIRLVYIFCFACFFSVLGLSGQALSNLRTQVIGVQQDSVALDSSRVVLHSVQVFDLNNTLISNGRYKILPEGSVLVWLEKPLVDSVRVQYRVYPYDFTGRVFTNDYNLYKSYKDSVGFLINTNIVSAERLTDNLIDFGKLTYDGDFSRGVRFGNGQSLSLNSSFNLQLAGNLAKDLRIKAAITDNNIPIQPEGNTAKIQDFDKVYIQLAYKKHFLQVGDFDIRSPSSYFMKFSKNLQGVSYWGTQKLNDAYTLGAKANISIARGTYALQNLVAEEGNQGPYKLVGNNGERFLIVLSGSERVYINGEQLKRGATNDYVIDYNLGEIRFTPKRLITKDLRIKVEFEYSENNYFRYMYHINAGVQHKLWSFDANFYSEQDVKNQALNQRLTDEGKQVLINVGDSLQKAFVESAVATSFDKNMVLYEKKDTSINTTFYSIYSYATDSTKTLYKLSFSYVGEGKGSYVPVQSVANGRVYKWQPPNSLGEPQGSYEPAVLLVAPKQKQLFTAKLGVQPTKTTAITGEFSLSNQDLNTFSTLNNEDNLGFATFFEVNDLRRLNKDSTQFFESKAAYEFKQKNFLPLERYRSVEFQRDWNSQTTQQVAEHLGFVETTYKTANQSFVGYHFGFFVQDSLYKGFQHKAQAGINQKGWQASAELKWLDAKTKQENTDFIRPKILLSKSIKALKYWKVGLSAFNEMNRIKAPSTDSLTQNSFWWQDYTFFVASSDSIRSKYNFSYNVRYEHKPNKNSFAFAFLRAHTLAFEGRFVDFKQHKLSWILKYRNFQQDESVASSTDLEHFYLARINYKYTLAKGAFVGNTLYEIGSGREQKIQYNYVQVPDGQGSYAWRDINENGIQELNEFYVSAFESDNVYMRLTTNSLEYQAVNTTKFNQALRINPKAVWFNKKGVRGFLARFSNVTSIRLSKKIFASKSAKFFDIINPVAFRQNDTLLVANSNLIRNTLFFNRNHSVCALDYTFNFNQNRNLLTSGFEKRLFTTHVFKIRWNILKQLTWQAQYKNGFKQNDSDFYFDRRYEYVLNETSTNIAWLFKRSLRIAVDYRYAFRSNPMAINGGQFAIVNEAGIELKYTKAANFNIVTSFKYASVAYNDDSYKNEQLEVDMLQSLQNGNNYIWMASFDKTIAKNFQISLQYDGRKTGVSKIVHTGRAQVRAIF